MNKYSISNNDCNNDSDNDSDNDNYTYVLSIHYLKVNGIINSEEQLFRLYINKQIFIRYCKIFDYETIIKKIKNIIKYRNKYHLHLNNHCFICSKSKFKQHSIEFKGIFQDNAIIYIEPAKAINFDEYYIAQHLLMELDNAFSNIITKNINIKKTNLIFIFNMRDNTTSLKNLKIAITMYKILNNCYISEIKNIYVYNMNGLIKFFTKVFNRSFNNKIINNKPDDILNFIHSNNLF